MNRPVRVQVFARAPVAGRCKTRLIPRYGALGAMRLHARLVSRALALALAAGIGPVELWTTPSPNHPYFARLRRAHGVALRRQCGGDLGRKMSHALGCALREGARGAVLIGTDAANLSVDDLRAAAAALADADAVLQPAQDGGFVLIAARCALGTRLNGVAWSSGRELRQTCARLRPLRLAMLPTRWDLDHPRDLRRARAAGLFDPGEGPLHDRAKAC